jgi:site-specific DNA-methyltransferase (adenine-specific)
MQAMSRRLVPYYSDEAVTIYHGDALEILPMLTADVIVTDPPYGYSYASNRGAPWRGVGIANDESTAARDAVLKGWGDGPAIVFGSWKRPRPDGVREILIWDKGGSAGMGDLSFPWGASHEEIYVWGSGFNGRRSGTVLTFPPMRNRSASETRCHPNEKPVDLMRTLVDKCPPGVVLDPFMGSGTTLRAAKDLGRKAIGIEIDERYCEIAAGRMGQMVMGVGEA